MTIKQDTTFRGEENVSSREDTSLLSQLSTNAVIAEKKRACPHYFLQPFWVNITMITWRSKMKSNRSAKKRFRVHGNLKLVQ